MLVAMTLAAAVSIITQEVGPHLRTEEPRIHALIDKGITRSPTFASLLDALKQTDVIVYVESRMLERVRGQVPHTVTVAGQYRYLRVQVMPTGSDDQIISTLAHEVQHAVEIARAPAVGRGESVESLYARIGFKRRLTYETNEALDMGQKVRDELARRPAADRAHVDVKVAVDIPVTDQR